MERDQLITSHVQKLDGEKSIDRYLLELITAGSEASLEILYDRHSGLIYSLVLHILGSVMDAEEVTQDVFLTVWAKSKSYSPSKGSVLAWMTSIARNRAIDKVRSKPYRIIQKQEPLDEAKLVSREYNPDDASRVDTGEERTTKILGSSLGRLADTELQVIELAYFEGLSHSKIADQLNLPLGTVKTRIRRAVNNLRTMLGSEDGQVDAA